MSKRVVIEEMLEVVKLRISNYVFLPFTLIYLDPKSIEISNVRGEVIRRDMVVLLLHNTYTTADALAYLQGTEEMNGFTASVQRDLIMHFFCKFHDEDELLLWIQQRIASALGMMQIEAKNLHLSLISHDIDLNSIEKLNQVYGLSPGFVVEVR